MNTRHCHCGKPIPKTTEKGRALHFYEYQQRQTCGDGACVGKFHLRGFGIPITDSPIDRFLYGR